MSRYTMQLRAVCNLYGESEVKDWFMDYDIEDYLSQEQISLIAERLPNWSKEKLAQKCIDKYYMREIGFETPYLFKHMLKVRLGEVMAEKLPILYSMAIEYDPLVNVDYSESFSRNINGTNTGNSQNTENVGEDGTSTSNSSATSNSTTNSSGLRVNSDTPQGRINKQDLLDGSWASSTEAEENTTTSSNTTSATDSTTTDRDIQRTQNGSFTQSDAKIETYTKNMKGNSGTLTTAQKLIEQYRNIIVAIDKEIIDELDNLFFGILN